MAMSKLYRILGKRGRITIPYEIRRRVGFQYNDVLSFTEQDDRTVVVRREKICDNCKGTRLQSVSRRTASRCCSFWTVSPPMNSEPPSFIYQLNGRNSRAVRRMPKMLRVLMVEPHESPHELFITDQLDDLQETVGGLIEVIGNGDGTLIVCNDEAKLNGMDGNRRLNGDVIAGPFFVVGEDGENFRSLTDEEMQKYMQRFKEIEDISPEEVQSNMGFYFFSL